MLEEAISPNAACMTLLCGITHVNDGATKNGTRLYNPTMTICQTNFFHLYLFVIFVCVEKSEDFSIVGAYLEGWYTESGHVQQDLSRWCSFRGLAY